MAQILNCSIDVAKIDKSKLVSGKNGAKYFNFQVIVNDDFDKYNNNVSICDSQTKEQREAKEKKTYLGNGRVVWSNQKQEYKNTNQNSSEDLPF